jgi:hypothetical protein
MLSRVVKTVRWGLLLFASLAFAGIALLGLASYLPCFTQGSRNAGQVYYRISQDQSVTWLKTMTVIAAKSFYLKPRALSQASDKEPPLSLPPFWLARDPYRAGPRAPLLDDAEVRELVDEGRLDGDWYFKFLISRGYLWLRLERVREIPNSVPPRGLLTRLPNGELRSRWIYLMAFSRPDALASATAFTQRYILGLPVWYLMCLFSAYPLCALIRGPLRRRRRRKRGLCVGCGYDLTGNVSGICPECGAGRQNGLS